MKLRVKIPAIIGVAVVITVIGLYFLISHVFLDEAIKLERQDLQEDIERARGAIEQDISTLKINVADYAAWDDTYAFMESNDPDYIDANFGSASFANLGVNVVVVQDLNKKVVYSRGFDTGKNEEITLSEKFFADLEKEDDLLEFKFDKQTHGEVTMLDGKPMMVATRQIIKSDETGPVRGTIIMAKNFDQTYLTKISDLTKINISLFGGVDKESLNQVFKPELLTAPGKLEMINPIDDRKVEAAFVIKCEEVEIVAVLKIIKDRSIYRLALVSVGEIMGILALFGAFLVFLVLYLTDFLVVKRLVKMSSKIENFDLESTRSPNLKLEGKDELASSSKILNLVFKHMVDSKVALNKSYKEIQDEKGKLDAILDSAGDMIVVIDEKGKIVLFNDEAERITGYKVKDMLGKSYMELIRLAPKDEQKAIVGRFEDALKRGIPSQDHKWVLTSTDGKEVPIEISEHPISYKAEKKLAGCVIVGRDITREYKVDQMKSEFVSLASHQLKTPLTGIKWMISLLTDKKTGKLNSTQASYIQSMNDSNERMIKLINNMLNISRLESGKAQVERSSLDLKRLLDEVISAQSAGAKERNIGFVIEKGWPKKIIISADRDKLYEVLMNLVNNAVKYSGDNNNVLLGCGIDKKNVIISVKDSGIGIPEEQQSRVFEKFFRADNALKTISLGTGLGLYYVKSVVEAHGGKIWFESKKDKGSTFFVSLPM